MRWKLGLIFSERRSNQNVVENASKYRPGGCTATRRAQRGMRTVHEVDERASRTDGRERGHMNSALGTVRE